MSNDPTADERSDGGWSTYPPVEELVATTKDCIALPGVDAAKSGSSGGPFTSPVPASLAGAVVGVLLVLLVVLAVGLLGR